MPHRSTAPTGLGWLAVTGLALYVLLLTDADPALRRGATILLATTVPMLREASPVIAGLAKENKIKVVGAYYDLGSGKVSLLS